MRAPCPAPARPLCAALLAAGLVACAAFSAMAETLTAGVSSSIVAIESNFTGSQIALFGTIERDERTTSRRHGYDVVVVVRGPDEQVVTWRKDRLAGIWVNSESRNFLDFPGYMAVLSSRPITDIASAETLKRFQLGLKNLILLQPSGAGSLPDADSDSFERAAIRLKQQRDLYLEQPYGVQFLSETLFQAHIPIPANVPVGAYTANIYLLRDGAMLSQGRIDISVRKSGFEQYVYSLAHNQPLAYGAGAVLLAVFAGWFAGVIFRR